MKSGQDLSDLRRAKSQSVNGNRPGGCISLRASDYLVNAIFSHPLIRSSPLTEGREQRSGIARAGFKKNPVSKSKHSQLHVKQASFSSHARPKMNNIFLQALSFYKVFQSFDSNRAKGKFVLVDSR